MCVHLLDRPPAGGSIPVSPAPWHLAPAWQTPRGTPQTSLTSLARSHHQVTHHHKMYPHLVTRTPLQRMYPLHLALALHLALSLVRTRDSAPVERGGSGGGRHWSHPPGGSGERTHRRTYSRACPPAPPPLPLPLSLPVPTLPPSLLTHTQTHTHSPTHHPSHPNRATTNGWTSLPSVYLGAAPAGVTQRPCACRRERPSWTYT